MKYFLLEPDDISFYNPLTLNRTMGDLVLGFTTLKKRLEFLLENPVIELTKRLLLEDSNYIDLEKEITGWFFSSKVIWKSNIDTLIKEDVVLENEGEPVCFYLENVKIKDVLEQCSIKELLKEKQHIQLLKRMRLGFLSHIGDFIKHQITVLEYDITRFFFEKENEKDFLLSNKYFSQLQIEGSFKNILIHKNTDISPYCVLNATKGAIIIEEGVMISALSYIEGPCYIGKNVTINQALIREGCSIGEGCRIGGEVEESIFMPYSNKNHEGFVGHSYVGSFVNFGALSTTSDLKNNYHPITLEFNNQKIVTESIKLGSFIGDFTKLGIGSLLNTGSCIGLGCNLFNEQGGMYEKDIPNFTWGTSSTGKKYKLSSFIDDTKTIMKRREKNLSLKQQQILEAIYNAKENLS